MSKCSSALNMFDSIEYLRMRRPTLEEIALKERPMRLACMVVLIVECFLTAITVLMVILSIYQSPVQITESLNALILFIDVLDIYTLTNGLFGKRHRGVCLLLNLLFFQIIPLFFSVIGLYVLKKQYEEIGRGVYTFTIVVGIIFTVYRVFAVVAIYRYRALLRQKEEIRKEERPPL